MIAETALAIYSEHRRASKKTDSGTKPSSNDKKSSTQARAPPQPIVQVKQPNLDLGLGGYGAFSLTYLFYFFYYSFQQTNLKKPREKKWDKMHRL